MNQFAEDTGDVASIDLVDENCVRTCILELSCTQLRSEPAEVVE